MKKLTLALLLCSAAYGQHQIYGGMAFNAPTIPAIAITQGGAPASTHYTYAVVVQYPDGSLSAPSVDLQTTTGPATLSPTNTNIVTVTSYTGASCYWFYRRASSGTPSTIGKLTCSQSPVFVDDGSIAGDGSSPVASPTAGLLKLPSGTILQVQGGAQLPAAATIGGVSTQSVSTVQFASGTPTFFMTLGDQKLTLTGAVSSSTMSGVVAGRKYAIAVCENGTGGFAFVAPTTWHGFPTLVTTPNICNYWLAESFDGTNLDFIAGSSH